MSLATVELPANELVWPTENPMSTLFKYIAVDTAIFVSAEFHTSYLPNISFTVPTLTESLLPYKPVKIGCITILKPFEPPID